MVEVASQLSLFIMSRGKSHDSTCKENAMFWLLKTQNYSTGLIQLIIKEKIKER